MRTVFFAPAALALILTGCASTSPTPTPGPESCRAIDDKEIAALFDRWNDSLRTGIPSKVVDNYAERSVLLATLSYTPRVTREQKEAYFKDFLKDKPQGKIDWRFVEIGCNSFVDAGTYTFTFHETNTQAKARFTYTYKWDGGKWLITSHHSSVFPAKP